MIRRILSSLVGIALVGTVFLVGCEPPANPPQTPKPEEKGGAKPGEKPAAPAPGAPEQPK